jgi:hypothetical protein
VLLPLNLVRWREERAARSKSRRPAEAHKKLRGVPQVTAPAEAGG